MSDTSDTIVEAGDAKKGREGERLLAAGDDIAMRMWENESPGDAKPVSTRDYETVGYVIAGRAELHLGDRVIPLKPGSSYAVPRGVAHTYRILETFSAVEATTPPSRDTGWEDE